MPKRKTAVIDSFGERLPHLRKAAGYTQVEFAAEVGITQRMVAYYEAPHAQPPAHLLPQMAQALGVSVEELIGEDASQERKQRGRTPKLMQHMERINALPKTQQKFVMQMIEMALAQAATQGAAR